jgi:hypothetical protein
LMWGFQKPIPWAKPGEKWVLMDRIFKSGLWTDLKRDNLSAES